MPYGDYIIECDWKKVAYPDDYLISTNGRVLSHKRGEWRELKPCVGKNGYEYVNLRDGENTIRKYIHRLVAETYIPNPDNKPEVNHIDGNKLNNSINNLEWSTYRENSIHAYHHDLSRMPDIDMLREKLRRPVKATHIDSKREFIFNSQIEAAKTLNITPPHISKVLHGECTHAKGYNFERLEKEVI